MGQMPRGADRPGSRITNRRIPTVLFLVLTAWGTPGLAQCVNGARTVWPTDIGGNGHSYQVICAPSIDWDDARLAAIGLGGHLATITSAAENTFVFNLANSGQYWSLDGFGNNIGPFLGANQALGSTEPAGGFSWVTSEPFAFTNFLGGLPDNFGGNEDSVHFFSSPGPLAGTWNDIDAVADGDGDVQAYVVEFVGAPAPVMGEPILGVMLVFLLLAGMRMLRMRRTSFKDTHLLVAGNMDF